MGHFFKIQPKISGPNPQKSSPDPTQRIIDTWYGILGYTENFIQQLLPYIQLVDSTPCFIKKQPGT